MSPASFSRSWLRSFTFVMIMLITPTKSSFSYGAYNKVMGFSIFITEDILIKWSPSYVCVGEVICTGINIVNVSHYIIGMIVFPMETEWGMYLRGWHGNDSVVYSIQINIVNLLVADMSRCFKSIPPLYYPLFFFHWFFFSHCIFLSLIPY